MVGKTKTGKGFRGILYYCLQEKKNPEILFQNNLIGSFPRELLREFLAVREENIFISKPVWHTSLSFSNEDGISHQRMLEIALRFMEKAGFSMDNHQFLVVKHNDKKHSHCHIIANRVGFDGKAVSDYYFKSKTVKWSKELEREFNLVCVQKIANTRKEKRALKPSDDLTYLRNSIDSMLNCNGVDSLYDLALKLKEIGIDMEVLRHVNTGKEYGVNFCLGGKTYKGSDIGKRYAYKSLSQLVSNGKKHLERKIVQKSNSNNNLTL